MAPSSKSERNSGAGSGGGGPGGAGGKRAAGRRREHVLRQLERVKISGQLSPRLFRKLPPRVCVSLKNIVDEDFLYAGHIFLGFSKCGRYVLSYTSSSGDDDFSFYIYHLYWWEFNVHSKLKLKDQVVLLNTSYSLVACAVSVHSAGDRSFCQILYDHSTCPPAPASPPEPQSPELPPALLSFCPEAAPARSSGSPEPSPAIAKAKEFVADIFRRAKEAKGGAPEEARPALCPGPSGSRCRAHSEPLALCGEAASRDSPPASEAPAPEPGYVNYTKLYYVLESGEGTEPEDEFEDDKISLPFVVTDLRGRNLRPMRERTAVQGQYLTVEQLTLDFEYVINEVIRHDATWGHQFCSFSDYDIVILEVCPETNQVLINIGLLLLAFPSPTEEGQLRPKTYHTSLKVAWDLNTGIFETVSVGDLTEVKGQTSGSVWSSYRKSCVDMVMKWLVPESSGRYVNRMTNEALHKGCSLKVLADSERYTWIVL
ncbi:DDB1- and CUL4-associated factor 15 isoform X9 [Symphalangus syndactylus]|uniref:DDB1- and CUL4-associated factor 15 isoform X9 n=1 Tax=Symphalangus syndactylus TaxID=9590 RepID=UPI0024427A3C|nr:DDB1- and CUL4-associated factor 15 isoform X9 [Symphalangus syndactylus]